MLLSYIVAFNGGISLEQSDWGALGDFFGGVLNPIISFIALLLLFFTVNIQSNELHISSKALKKNNKIQDKRENIDQRNLVKESILARIEYLKFRIQSEDKGFRNLFVQNDDMDEHNFEILDLGYQLDWIAGRTQKSEVILKDAGELIDGFFLSYFNFFDDNSSTEIEDQLEAVKYNIVASSFVVSSWLMDLDNPNFKSAHPSMDKNIVGDQFKKHFNDLLIKEVWSSLEPFMEKTISHYEVMRNVSKGYAYLIIDLTYKAKALNKVDEIKDFLNKLFDMLSDFSKILSYQWDGKRIIEDSFKTFNKVKNKTNSEE